MRNQNSANRMEVREVKEAAVVNEKDCPFYAVAWGRTKGLLAPESGVVPKNLQMRMTEYQPFSGHSRHVHPTQEEVIYVLSGKGVSETKEGKRELYPGCVAYVPAGIEHMTFNPNAEPMLALVILSPPDSEQK